MDKFKNPAQTKVHNSFEKVAGIQTFWIEDLIHTARSNKKSFYASAKRDMDKLDALMASDAQSNPIEYSFTLFDENIQRAVENHDVEVLLKKMREQGVERLELNPNYDLNTQIFVQASNLGIMSDRYINTPKRDDVQKGNVYGTRDAEPEDAPQERVVGSLRPGST